MQPPEPLVRIGSLVVRQERPHLLNRRWVVMFYHDLNISRVAKAALYDLSIRGLRTSEGIIAGTVDDIDMPSTSAYRAVQELCRTGAALRFQGRIYLNPAIVFAGRVERHREALEKWEKMEVVL